MKKHLFIIDPLHDILPKIKNDSSTAIMQEGLERGHKIFITTLPGLVYTSNFLKVKCQMVRAIDLEKGYELDETLEEFAHDFDVIWLRKNPPFDETYLMHLALFDQLQKHKIIFINDPGSIRALNEKLSILNFPEYIVETLVTMNLEEIKKFWENHQKIVVKGLTGFGGDSVIMIEDWTKDEEKLIKLSQNGKRFLMVQKFIENVYQGDKRITIFDGEIVSTLIRIPPKNSFIAYTGAGATVEKTEVNESETKIAQNVGKFLKQNGIFWGAIDLIDGYLSEINITSPSFLASANRQMDLKLEKKLWDSLENY